MHADAYIRLLARRPGQVIAAAALVLIGALALAARLELRTNVAELLPSRDQAVRELERLGERVGGTAVLQVAIESPDRAANLRFAEALGSKLAALPPDVVQSVTWNVRRERAFFHDHRWLYAPLGDLEALAASLRSEIARAKSPLLVELDEPEPAHAILDRLQTRGRELDFFPSGYFESPDGHLVVIVCRPPGGLFAERAGERLADKALQLARETDPHAFQPQMRVGLTGDVMAQLDERAALERDLKWATLVCVTLVCLAVVLFYGRPQALVFLGVPALLGVAVAFACAELLFGYLNASTAFMGSIIVGNGINFPIIVLARYEEERRAGRATADALAVTLSATLRPTIIAALGAAVAYASLALTRFRGFSQFGAIGGIGMLAAWTATLVVLPALLLQFDGHARPPRPPAAATPRAAAPPWPCRAPRAAVALFLLVSVVSVLPLGRYLRDPFEYDLSRLRNRRTLVSGAAALAPRVDKIFGHTLTPAVILADQRAHTGEIRDIVLRRDRQMPGEPLIGAITTIEDLLPGTLAEQRRKIAVLEELRHLIDDPVVRASLGARLESLRPPDDLRPVRDADLPETFRHPFTEVDGTLGRIVLVYHAEHVSVWDGHNLLRIADLIGEVRLHDGTVVRTSGHAVVFAAMIRSIVHDAPRASLASLLGVTAVVLLLVRGRGAALVIGMVLAGALWMLGAAAYAGVRTNFLNFIALPITFGIGVDYGINVYLRSRLEGPGGVDKAVRATGGAVALCSLTTVIGYAALLVADNQALQSFGAMAVLGEIACLAAALIGMPAVLVLLERRTGKA